MGASVRSSSSFGPSPSLTRTEHIVKRYRFDAARLIDVDQPLLMRNAIIIGLIAAAVVFLVASRFWFGGALAIAAGIAAGYFFYDRNRETVLVRDLMHGRYFTCDSVVDLARKEAWLSSVAAVLRQVMETAKHWMVPRPFRSKRSARKRQVRGNQGPLGAAPCFGYMPG